MQTLLDIERAILAAIVNGSYDSAALQIAGARVSPTEALDIYRNTFLSSLTNALRVSFPAVHRLVGEDFFAGVAQCFIEAHPPQSAYLNAYGADFSAFLSGFPPAQSLPYLADVARLEWAVNGALHAPDAKALDAAAFAALADAPTERLILTPHPAITHLRLDHAAEAIWRAVLAEDQSALGEIDSAPRPEWLTVERGPHGVEVSRITEDEWRFAAALSAGKTFANAMEAAPGVDAVRLFAQDIAAGRFIAFRLVGDDPNQTMESKP
jgi:hypothetical protein